MGRGGGVLVTLVDIEGGGGLKKLFLLTFYNFKNIGAYRQADMQADRQTCRQAEEEGEHERRVSGRGKGHACRKRRRESMREE